jgi:hypothetical protein
VDPATDPTISKVAYKYLCYRESLLWRSEEIAKSARGALLENRLVSATILVRSLLECAACFHYISEKINTAIQQQSTADLDQTAMKLLMGSRWKDWEHQSINVQTMIDILERKFPGAHDLYYGLSEISHPNWSGTFGAYSSIDHETGKVDFMAYRSDGEPLFERCLLALSTALMIISKSYNDCSDQFIVFNELCRNTFEDDR